MPFIKQDSNPTFGVVKDRLHTAMVDAINTSNPHEVKLYIDTNMAIVYSIVTIVSIELDNMRYLNLNEAETLACSQEPSLHNYLHMLDDVMPDVLQQYKQPTDIQWMDLSSDTHGVAILAYNRTISVLLTVDNNTEEVALPPLQ